MTTNITISPAGHHVLVTTIDQYGSEDPVVHTHLLQPSFHYVEGQRVETGQGPVRVYATTSRTITVVDLEPHDPRVTANNRVERKPDAVDTERRDDP